MVQVKENPAETTVLRDCYELLSPKDKGRAKYLIMVNCGINSSTTFYRWLDDHTHISNNDRYYISQVFGIECRELFKSKKS